MAAPEIKSAAVTSWGPPACGTHQSIAIRRSQHTMNRDEGSYHLSHIYDSLLKPTGTHTGDWRQGGRRSNICRLDFRCAICRKSEDLKMPFGENGENLVLVNIWIYHKINLFDAMSICFCWCLSPQWGLLSVTDCVMQQRSTSWRHDAIQSQLSPGHWAGWMQESFYSPPDDWYRPWNLGSERDATLTLPTIGTSALLWSYGSVFFVYFTLSVIKNKM